MADQKFRFEILLYVLLFVVGFVIFAVVRVPSERLARISLAYVENAGYNVEYESIGSTLLPGFKLNGVRVFDESGSKVPFLELSEFAVRTTLLPLFVGKAGVLVSAEGYGGNLKARILHRGQTNWVVGKMEDVDMGAIPMFQDKLKVPVQGSIDAEFDLEILPTIQQSVGNVNLVLNNFRIDEGMLMGTFKFPGSDLGDVHGSLILENGKIIFDRFAGDGADIKLATDGDIMLQDPLQMSGLNLTFKLQISPRIEQSLGFAFPLLGLNKDPQGQYVRKVGGTISSPR
jgi:type II secretion system protein N